MAFVVILAYKPSVSGIEVGSLQYQVPNPIPTPYPHPYPTPDPYPKPDPDPNPNPIKNPFTNLDLSNLTYVTLYNLTYVSSTNCLAGYLFENSILGLEFRFSLVLALVIMSVVVIVLVLLLVTHTGGYYGVLRSTRVVPVIFRRQISNVARVKHKIYHSLWIPGYFLRLKKYIFVFFLLVLPKL
jgi:hypothetical protein